jgi:molybdopterin molybdotransferase
MMTPNKDLISVEEAQKIIFSKFNSLEIVKKKLIDSSGHILSKDIKALFDLPSKNNSAMDGFAVRHQDLEVNKTLKVVGRVGAESITDHILQKDEAIRIMTGSGIPKGADSVIQFEKTNNNPHKGDDYPDSVTIIESVSKGGNIRMSGMDYKAGQTVVKSGMLITPPIIGAIASFGIDEVPVIKKPTVSLISTGNEIIMPGQKLKEGQIYDSNSFAISSAIRNSGANFKMHKILSDDKNDVEKLYEDCNQSDLIVTIGGVSKGDFDLIRDAITEKGNINFWGINMKPGKPLAFGQVNLNGKEIFHIGLPGNSVSSYVCFELFIRPVLMKMQGLKNIFRKTLVAKVDKEIKNNDGRRAYLRVMVSKNHEKGYTASIYDKQDSNIFSSLVYSNGLAICPEECKVIKSGDQLEVIMLED